MTENIFTACILGVTCGFIISISIVLVWLIWANFIYKYDVDRLGNIGVLKYNSFNGKNLLDSQYFSYDNVSLQNGQLSLRILVKNKEKQTIMQIIPMIYNVGVEGSCNILSNDCVLI